ncbi:parathyroid hormone 2 receptor [Trichuris trichiura]|uniref:Parathyroid hormone 2 receptor n=1 Tax=Trichuris trichiura TaxID=36087 RepID=A0A077YV10_TRITR|nr:parathyroid hormone 2 receptor [Trichuris trichiura]
MTNVARGVEVEKLLDVVNATDSAQPFHHCVYADGHVYLFGLKGAEQSQYSSYKRTILLGSYAVDVDLKNKTYTQSYFSSIDKTEDRKEYVFAVHDEIYMVTYSEYEMCTFHDLYTWTSGSWKPVALTVESKARLEPGGSTSNCKLSYTVVANDSVLFAFSQNDKKVVFSRLNIVGEAAVISHLFTVDKLSRPRSSIVFAGLYDQKLTAILGSQGCGFRWNSEEVLSIDLKQGSVTYYPTNGERPPWAFNGPDSTFQWNNTFLLVGGSKALGISNMSFSPEIWALDLVSYNYTKLPVEVPSDVANFQLCSTFDACSGQLYFTDLTHGLYRVNMTELV